MREVVTYFNILLVCNIVCTLACMVMCIKLIGVSKKLKTIKKKLVYSDPEPPVNARVVKLKEQGLTDSALEYLDKKLDKELDFLLDTGIGTKYPTTSVERAKEIWHDTVEEYTRYYNYLGSDLPDKFKNIDIDLVVTGIWSLS